MVRCFISGIWRTFCLGDDDGDDVDNDYYEDDDDDDYDYVDDEGDDDDAWLNFWINDKIAVTLELYWFFCFIPRWSFPNIPEKSVYCEVLGQAVDMLREKVSSQNDRIKNEP